MTLAAMKRSRILTALAMVASWSCSALASPESDFWAWFQREEPKLFACGAKAPFIKVWYPCWECRFLMIKEVKCS